MHHWQRALLLLDMQKTETLPPTGASNQSQAEEDGSMWKGVRSLATKLIDSANDEEPAPEVEGVDYKLGKLQYAIAYDFRTLTLTVTIFRACALPAKDFTGTSDPYVKVLLLPDKKHKLLTKVRKRNLNPHWNERFVFEDWPHHKLLEKTLYLQVIDYDRFSRDDPIGEITLPLNEVDLTQKKSTWRFLEPCKESRGKLGEVLLSLCYQPAVGRLIIEVKKAKELKAKDITGTSDPYVKMWLMHGNTRVEKRKTTIKRRTLNPTFDETFIFDISWEKIRESQIHVIVMDFDKLGRNELIGKLVLGSRSGPTEMKHWNDMVSKPRQSVSQWHILKD